MPGSASNFPTTANALGKIIQVTDGQYSETYTVPAAPGPYIHQLGSGLVPAQPSGWQNVPVGAYPIQPPGAVTLGSPQGYNTPGGFLTPGATYKVAMTNVTDFGETIVGAITTFTLGAGLNAANYVLPAVAQGTADAPIRKRRLYRTAANGTTLLLLAELGDLAQTTFIDGTPDAFLTVAPPASNGSGSIGSVSVSGGGKSAGYWQEVAPGTALVGGQYIVDYSTGTTGGRITHAAADAGLAGVTVQYTAGTLASATVENNIIGAIQDTAAVLGSNPKGTYADLTARLAANDAQDTAQGNDINSFFGTFPNANAGHAPRLVGNVQVSTTRSLCNGRFRDAVFGGRYVAVGLNGGASVTGAYSIISVDTPASPAVVGTLASPNNNETVGDIVAFGHQLIAARALFNKLDLVDVTNPAAPSLAFAANTVNNNTGLAPYGPWALTSFGGTTVEVAYDISRPNFDGAAHFQQMQSYTISGSPNTPVATVKEYAVFFSTTGGALFNAATGVSVGTLPALSTPVDAQGVGRYLAVVTSGDSKLTLIDCATATAPTTAGTLTLPGTPAHLVWLGRYIAITQANGGSIWMVDVSTPTAPTLVNTINTTASQLGGLAVVGRYLLVASIATTGNYATSLLVYDLTSKDVDALNAGSGEFGRARVQSDLEVGNRASVGQLQVGRAGAMIDGILTAQQIIAPGVRQTIAAWLTADAWCSSAYQAAGLAQSAFAKPLAAGNLTTVNCTSVAGGIQFATNGGSLKITLSGNLYNNIAAADWAEIGVALDSGNVTVLYATTSAVDGGTDIPDITAAKYRPFTAVHWISFSGVPAGTHTLYICMKAGGGAGVTQAVGLRGTQSPPALSILVEEFA